MKDDKDEGDMELKTNEDGKTAIDVIPIGDTIQLQIIAHGFQTYGKEYTVDKSHLAVAVRMKRPGEQYSIYKEHPDDKKIRTMGQAESPGQTAAVTVLSGFSCQFSHSSQFIVGGSHWWRLHLRVQPGPDNRSLTTESWQLKSTNC